PLGGSGYEEPRAPGSPRVGGEELRLLERGRVIAKVDPVCERGDVQRERPLADRLAQALIGARAALVPGHVRPRGVARGVRAEGVEVGGPPLVGALALLGAHRAGSVAGPGAGPLTPPPALPGDAALAGAPAGRRSTPVSRVSLCASATGI